MNNVNDMLLEFGYKLEVLLHQVAIVLHKKKYCEVSSFITVCDWNLL